MASYQLRVIDMSAGVLAHIDLDCASMAEAVTLALGTPCAHPFQLWDGATFIGQFEPAPCAATAMRRRHQADLEPHPTPQIVGNAACAASNRRAVRTGRVPAQHQRPIIRHRRPNPKPGER